jgi:hypothetical protein
MPTLEEVDFNPFEVDGVSLEPVDYDPFTEKPEGKKQYGSGGFIESTKDA